MGFLRDGLASVDPHLRKRPTMASIFPKLLKKHPEPQGLDMPEAWWLGAFAVRVVLAKGLPRAVVDVLVVDEDDCPLLHSIPSEKK